MGIENKESVNSEQASIPSHNAGNTINMRPERPVGSGAGVKSANIGDMAGSAWSDWLAKNGSRMLLFARQQTRTAEDAEDVLQDALVKLARKVEERTFDGGQESWKPFLYTAIRRLSIDLGRKNDRRSKREKKSEGDRYGENGGMSDPWFENSSSNHETRALLENSLKKLPEKFSEVIVMKIWGERTFAEIGEILDVSLNTVASRYRYGLERLRKGLEPSRLHDDI